MKKKFLGKVIAMLMATATCVSAVGCFGGGDTLGEDNDKTLQIYIGNYGYGYEWVEDAAQAFKEQAWVKEKYGEIEVPVPVHNSDKTYAETNILAGAKANVYDVMFSTASANASVFNTDKNGDPYFEDLTSLLDETVPGESVTLRQKMKPDILQGELLVKPSDVAKDQSTVEKKLYGMPWVNGYMGLLYNETLINQELGEQRVMPRTTKELQQLIEDLIASQSTKAEADQIPVSCFSATTGYYSSLFNLWWAQYEGIEEYENFYNGKNAYGDLSVEIFNQTGRLRALESVQMLTDAGKSGLNHKECNTMTFTQAQSRFILRQGFMMANGDWFENEMRASSTDNPYANDKIKYMKLPIISEVVDDGMVTSVANETELVTIVQAIDEGKTYEQAKALVPALSESDYNYLKDGRNVTNTIDGHVAYIPYYATAKSLAKDFLRFLATDEGIRIFMTKTNGCATAYQYDYSKLNFTLPAMHQSKLEMQKDSKILKNGSSFPLQYLGGLRPFSKTSVLEVVFAASNAGDRKTPQQIFDEDITYYTKDQNQYWNALLTRVGLN